jgi:large subunit ribosomal protein L29
MMADNKKTANDLRGLSRKELNDQVIELKQELFGLRFQHATGQLTDTQRLREVRKDIARVYTVIQERNLGIVVDPEVAIEKAEAAKAEAQVEEDAKPAKKAKKEKAQA